MKKWLKKNIGFLYVAPWLLGFLIFKMYPFGSSLIYSFSDYQLEFQNGVCLIISIFLRRKKS